MVDFLDVFTMIPVFAITIHILRRMPGGITWKPLLMYGLLTVNGLVIALAFHIGVASLAVLTQELENTIWIYRDLMTLGRFPSDIYDSTLRAVLTFIVPVAVIVSFPAKAYLGMLSWTWVGQALLMACVTLVLSLKFWKFATRRYTSVSS